MNVNLINLEEPLQSSLIQKVLKSPGKTSLKVSKDKEIEKNGTLKKGLQNVDEKDNQNSIIKTLSTPQPFLLKETPHSKETETSKANRAPFFGDFSSFVEQKRLSHMYDRFHQNEIKIRELETRVNNLSSLLYENLRLLRSDIGLHLKKETKVNKKKLNS